jgi:acetylornithine deacetylase/succinyl-diaminopimelate desuccinylase-like protein
MPPELSRPSASDSPPPEPPPGLAERARELLAGPQVQAARDHLHAHDDQTVAEQVALSEIPAPPFGEEQRGRAMAERMEDSGLGNVDVDGEGNVTGWYGEPGPAPMVVAAHLDTVFPAGTDVEVQHKGDRILGPGIGDDGRGLAAILALARSLAAGGIRPGRPLLVVATVGEEGAGDLRGVRHLFGPEGAARDASAFVSLDGAGHRRIVNRAVGARRWRVTARGPGGHSWVDWGTPNPIHALGRAVARLEELPRPGSLTLSVGRIGGGRSVNAIPEEAWMEVEIRSRVEEELAHTARTVQALLETAVRATSEARRQGTGPLTLEMEVMGERPAGATPAGAPLVQAAVAATTVLGYRAELASSSTDANVPMALGIPAITMGAGGEAGQAHTLQEWYRNVEGPEGILRALLTLLLLDETDRAS